MHDDSKVLFTVLNNISKKHSRIVSGSAEMPDQFWYLGCDLPEFYTFMSEMAAKLNCIPNTTDYFYSTPSIKFLDIGCGTGITLLIARAFGFNEFGIENDPATLRILETVYDDPGGHIFNMNALDFKNYGDYDVLHIYRPFSSESLEEQLECTIMEQMKPGAILKGQYLVKAPTLFRKE